MKNSIIRLAALLLSVMLLASMLAGCASEKAAEPETPETTETVETPVSDETSEPAQPSQEPAEEPQAEEEAVEEPVPQEIQEPQSYMESLGILSDRGAAEIADSLGIESTVEYFPVSETKEISSTYVYPPFAPNFLPTGDMNEKLVYQELEKLTNVHVNWTAISMASADQDYSLLLATGDYPDLFYMYGKYNSGSSYEAAIEDEIMLDLRDIIKDYCPSYNYIISSNKDILAGASTASGYISEFISIEAGTGCYYPQYIRQDWLDELGLDTPQTYDQLHDVLTAFKDEYNCSSALWIPEDGIEQRLVFGFDVTTGWYLEDGEIVYGQVQDGFRDYLSTMNQWYEEGLISVEFMSLDNDYDATGASLINNGQVGVLYVKFDTLSNFGPETANDDNFKLSPLASMTKTPGETIQTATSTNVRYSQSAGWSISTCVRDLELAARWCDFWYTEAGSMLANYGVEGNTFVYDEDTGKPVWTDMILNNPDGMAKQQSMAVLLQYRGGGYVADTWKDNQSYDLDMLNACNEAGANLTGEKVIPSGVSLNAEESSSNALIMTDIETHIEESVLRFITGDKDINDDSVWQEYVDTCYALGLDDAKAIQVGAYERYLNS